MLWKNMNWLAHLYLSDPTPEFRVGNLLPDLTAAAKLAGLSEAFQKGIRRHKQIDHFTDAHPRFKSCVSRFPKPFRRYGGVLTDVYFDHFLARDWSRYSESPLSSFIDEVYRDIDACLAHVPTEAGLHLHRMRHANWLGSYHTLAGISEILRRMSGRMRRPFDLSRSLHIFREHESAFSHDFHNFFPELMKHVRQAE